MASKLISWVAAGLLGMCGAAAAAPNWDEILGPSQGTLPPPRARLESFVELPTHRQVTAKTNIKWEADLPAALRMAKQENRPVFVTMRCLPCKACSDFDKAVLEGGADLDPLFRQFVTVRLTSVKDVDLRLLPMEGFQDMDVSWWGWLLSPDGQIYSTFGGRDQHGDANRVSKQSLVNTLQRVLAHHYDPRRAQWNIDGPPPKFDGEPTTPIDLPGFDSWLAKGEHKKQFTKDGCIHCHQAAEIMRQPAIDAGTFDKHKDTEVWPYPENLGLTLDKDHGLLVKKVEPNSAADKAGLKPNDVLGAAAGRRLFAQSDFRAVMHRTPRDAKTLPVVYTRNGAAKAADIPLADGWRKTVLHWRTTIADGQFGPTPGFWPVDAARWRQKLNLPAGAMCVEPYGGGQPEVRKQFNFKQGDAIIAVDGDTRPVYGREWLTWFRFKYQKGDTVKFTIKNTNTGQTREVSVKY